MRVYPEVLSEFDTMAAVVSGRSIARYGDGEFKMAERPVGIKSQEHDPRLMERLAEILQRSGECLVGIPNIHQVIASRVSHQKVTHWTKFQPMKKLLNEQTTYASAFITRPDSAPWINVPEFWAMWESLWSGQDITLVRGSGKSLTAERLMEWGARSVREVQPRLASNGRQQHAFEQYGELMTRIGRPKRVLICLGPTATVMAVDLCAKGVHAIDAGHIGMFLKKVKAGEPIDKTDDDKAVDDPSYAKVPA